VYHYIYALLYRSVCDFVCLCSLFSCRVLIIEQASKAYDFNQQATRC